MLRSFDLKWDGDDNLRQAYQQGTLWMQATYNGDGLRVHKQDIFTPTHDYTWGLGGVLYDAANNTTTTPGVSQNVNGVDQFFESDWLGSTRYLTDSTGNNAPSLFRYDAFGERTVTGSGNWSPTESLFAGEWGYQTEWSNYNEPGLGLQYLSQRYYDPAVGRFISPDPSRFLGVENLYLYAGNDPIGGVDPTGWDVYIITWGGGLGDAGQGSHAAIAVDWPGAKFPKVFDFGPLVTEGGPRNFRKAAVIGAVPGEVLDEAPFDPKGGLIPSHVNEPADSVIRVLTSPGQDLLIRRWLLGTRTTDPEHPGTYGKYQFPGQQCSTYVRDALGAGGLLGGPPVAGVLPDMGFMPMVIYAPLQHGVISPLDVHLWALSQPGARRLR